MPEKRHLNVIVAPVTTEPVPARSRVHWTLLGVILVVTVWLPLVMLGLWLSRLVVVGFAMAVDPGAAQAKGVESARPVAALLPILGSFALAAYGGGLVTIRFGSAKSHVTALLVGGLSGALVASLAAAAGALRPWPVGVTAYISLILIGAVAAFCGGRRGQKLGNAATLEPPDLPN